MAGAFPAPADRPVARDHGVLERRVETTDRAAHNAWITHDAEPDPGCALRRVSGGDYSLPLTISADANARHQYVVTAMDVAGRLGFVQINIATVDDPAER